MENMRWWCIISHMYIWISSEDTFQGPQINKDQFDKIMNYRDIGQMEGATLYYGGKRHGDKGYYIQPTIFTDCTNDMRVSI